MVKVGRMHSDMMTGVQSRIGATNNDLRKKLLNKGKSSASTKAGSGKIGIKKGGRTLMTKKSTKAAIQRIGGGSRHGKTVIVDARTSILRKRTKGLLVKSLKQARTVSAAAPGGVSSRSSRQKLLRSLMSGNASGGRGGIKFAAASAGADGNRRVGRRLLVTKQGIVTVKQKQAKTSPAGMIKSHQQKRISRSREASFSNPLDRLNQQEEDEEEETVVVGRGAGGGGGGGGRRRGVGVQQGRIENFKIVTRNEGGVGGRRRTSAPLSSARSRMSSPGSDNNGGGLQRTVRNMTAAKPTLVRQQRSSGAVMMEGGNLFRQTLSRGVGNNSSPKEVISGGKIQISTKTLRLKRANRLSKAAGYGSGGIRTTSSGGGNRMKSAGVLQSLSDDEESDEDSDEEDEVEASVVRRRAVPGGVKKTIVRNKKLGVTFASSSASNLRPSTSKTTTVVSSSSINQRLGGKAQPQPKGTRVSISNLGDSVSEDDVQELCESIGEVVGRAKLISGGWAEAAFVKRADALRAIQEFDRRELDGVPMAVKLVPTPAATMVSAAASGSSGSKGGGGSSSVLRSSALRSSMSDKKRVQQLEENEEEMMDEGDSENEDDSRSAPDPDRGLVTAALFRPKKDQKKKDVTFTVKI